MTRRRKILIAAVTVVALGITSFAIAISHNSPCPAPPPQVEQGITAVMARCYGSPSVLTIEQIAKPVPADDQVIVKVHAAGLNPLDWHGMRGEPYFMRMIGLGWGAPVDTRVGLDFSGTVEAVGEKVTRFKPGDEVFGGRGGAVAEFIDVRESGWIVHKPAGVTFEEAAAIPVAAITALQALRDKGALQSGQRVLINGASGGVGTFAVQIAKSMGAEVTGVCSTRNLELVKSLGADHVVDYTKENFTDASVQYDLIVDNVGTQTLSNMRGVLAPTGRIVIVGGASRDPWIGPIAGPLKAAITAPFVEQKMGMILAQLNQTDLGTLAELFAAGKVRSVIDKVYSLNEVATAMEYLETGRVRGKVVIRIAE